MNFVYLGFFFLMTLSGYSDKIETKKATPPNNTFSVVSGIACTAEPSTVNRVSIHVDSSRNKRIIRSNAIPDHRIGPFPNMENPNRLREQHNQWSINLHPELSDHTTSICRNPNGSGPPAYQFGVAINGVKLDPAAAEFYRTPLGFRNLEWSKEALSTNTKLGDDCNNAHVQPHGEYHYHGTPWGLVKRADGKEMFLCGWAADGFPVYYKWGYREGGNGKLQLRELSSSYRLRRGERPGDGYSTPDGSYDGTYVRDFEYVEQLGDLDQCNGIFGITPEFPGGTYYYLITDAFPSVPRCFSGTPSEDFNLGPRPQRRKR